MTETFSWLSVESKGEGEVHETVDFADILKATSLDPHGNEEPESSLSVGSTGNLREILTVSDLDACDGILAEERLQDAEWIDWSDVKRDLHRST